MEQSEDQKQGEQGGVSLTPSVPATADVGTSQQTGIPVSRADTQDKQRKPRCRFYNTKNGCRAGDACPFRHEQSHSNNNTSTQSSPSTGQLIQPGHPIDAPGSHDVQASQLPRDTKSSSVVDARAFQLNQIKRRFRPKEEEVQDSGQVVVTFSMPPSDPDFPFDISALECILKIPADFPKQKPTLRVTNKEMERGFQVNVEQGFDEIWRQAANPTLLNALKVLDKRLESLLTAQKAEIFKIIANAGATSTTPREQLPSPTAGSRPMTTPHTPQDATQEVRQHQEVPTPERISQARKKRETETRLLEHRLGRDTMFSKSNDHITFTIPIEPRMRDQLPSSLRAIKTVRLIVPMEYDIEPCTINLSGIDGEPARAVYNAFRNRAKQHPEATLLAHINYLAQNMHLMAKETAEIKAPSTLQVRNREAAAEQSNPPESLKVPDGIKDTDKNHLKIIPRPPEWDSQPRESNEDDDSTDGYDSEIDTSYDEGSEGELGTIQEDANASLASNQSSTTPREKGILVSFPGLELYGIELLELVLVNLAVKCERCKDAMDIQRIKPQSDEQTAPGAQNAAIHSTSCKKCANPFSIGYRKDIMHPNSVRAGYLDLEGCTVADLLPSIFLPTCVECSTPANIGGAGGVTSVRGESTMSICRTCHRKMVFRIPEVKFLHVGGVADISRLPLKPRLRKPKEALGIVAGTELPGRGRCKHYSKSYRWFRFSCCNKVFACDKCHDAESDHPNEFANRMICGWCSREQIYRPEDCGIASCRKNVTGRSRSGFWEGGKGTRERARMSRKDPRKYKRRGGGAVASKSS